MNDHITFEMLMIRFLQGAATPAEEERLRLWRDEDPANEHRFRDLQDLWFLTGLGMAVAEDAPGAESALEPRRQRAVEPVGTPEQTRGGAKPLPMRGRAVVRSRWVWRGALAAGLAAVGFGAAYLGLARMSEPDPVAVRSVETAAGERATVMLLDGSSVRLGPSSRMRIHEKSGEQRVELTGRAFFAAENTPTRSLIVETTFGQVVTIGTRFEVRAEDGTFRVLVVDGRVAVSVADEGVEVGRGEMTPAAEGDRLSKTTVTDVYAELEWMGNHLAFKATPLERAVQELRERFGVDIWIDAPELSEFPVTATFTDQPVAVVIRVLCELTRATCEISPDGVRIDS